MKPRINDTCATTMGLAVVLSNPAKAPVRVKLVVTEEFWVTRCFANLI